MALSLSCSCGAEFEVEDTFAGQGVSCPDCGAAVRAPLRRPVVRRTSGYALASIILALVGAFTLIGTIAAVVLGIVGLVSVARNRDRVRGAGFALCGVILGVLLTILTGFAAVSGEVFDRVREQVTSGRVDRSGPREVLRPADGFAITRPTRDWGIATVDLASELGCEDSLVLVQLRKDTYIEVAHQDAGGQTLEQFREDFLNGFRQAGPARGARKWEDLTRFTDFKLRESNRLAPLQGAEVAEVLFDAKMAGQKLTFRTRLVKPRGRSDVYIIHAWAHRRRMLEIEAEVLRAMNSFRLLTGGT
jgi:DNA-directed RNA polymerase subunit RPC12/RpoP